MRVFNRKETSHLVSFCLQMDPRNAGAVLFLDLRGHLCSKRYIVVKYSKEIFLKLEFFDLNDCDFTIWTI